MKKIYGIFTDKKEKGITTIALVITIIVLLILAGIVLYFMTKSNIIDKAFDSKEETIRAKEKELISLAYLDCQMNYRTNQEPIDVENFQIAMRKQDEKTNTTQVSDEEGNEGEIVADIENHTGFARVTFEETKHDYYIGLLEGNAFQIKYDSVGGIDGPQEQIKREGKTLIITDKVPTKLDYEYVEWNTNEDGSGDRYVAGDSYTEDKSITLYAIWKPSANPTTYTITYNLNGGGISEPNPASYNIFTGDIKLNNPTKSGHVFTGWIGTDLNEKTKTVIIKGGSRGNREYTANWSVPMYAVDGNESYLTLEEAFAACNDGSTITLLRDVTDESTTIVNTKNIKVNLNGHTVETQATINNNGTLHIIDKDNNGNSLGGKIVNNNDTCIANKGILQLGENDQEVNISINIEGVTGIQNEGTFKYYDGQIVGNKAIRGNIDETADDYKAVSMRANDKEVVNLKQLAEYQARIVGIYYPTLSKAIEAVQKDETVTLLVGLSLDSSLEIKDKDRFILDLNGNTITTNIQDYVLKNYSDLEIVDSSNEKTGLIEGTSYSTIYNAKDAKLNVNGGTINTKKTGTSAKSYNTILNERGDIVINDGIIKSDASFTNIINNYGGNLNVNGGNILSNSNNNKIIKNSDYIIYDKLDFNNIKNGSNEYYFEIQNGKLIPNNKGKSDTTANSYFEIDLSNIDSNKKVRMIVNAKVSSESVDKGYATITESDAIPDVNESSGRFIYISGTVNDKDYETTLVGGKKYYLHLGYTKDTSVDKGDDLFTINSISLAGTNDIIYPSSLNISSGAIKCENNDNSGKIYGLYNSSISNINISGGTIEIGEKISLGIGIYNEGIGKITIGGNTQIKISSWYDASIGVKNEAGGSIEINDEVKISTYITRYSDSSYGINNNGNGTIVVNGGEIMAKSDNGTSNAAGIANTGTGTVKVEGGTIDGIATAYSNPRSNGVYNGGEGNIEVNGGTISASITASNTPSNANSFGIGNYGSGTIKIAGGTITSSFINSYQYSSYSSSSYSLGVGNAGIGMIDIDGNSIITGDTNKKVNSAATGNIGEGILSLNKGTISSELNSVYSNNGTTEINSINLVGTVYNAGGLIKVINKSNEEKQIVAGSSEKAGIINSKGTIELGIKESDNTNFIINGTQYGILNYDTFNYYDGMLKGTKAIYGVVSEVKKDKLINIENDTVNNLEIAQLIDSSNYFIVENTSTGKQYSTLQSAINDCADDNTHATIKIIKNNVYITKSDYDNITISQNKNITIDINGKIIYMGQEINNNGTFEIMDSSTDSGKIITAYEIHNNGNLTVGKGTNIENIAKESKTIVNKGTITINGTITNSNEKSYSIYNDENGIVNVENEANISITENMDYSYGIYNYGNGRINVNGGTISVANSYSYAIYNNGDGDVIVNDGDLMNNSYSSRGGISSTILNNGSGTIEMNGGNITSMLTAGILNKSDGMIKVTNGTIEHTNKNAGSNSIENSENGNVNIEGGKIKNGVINYKKGAVKVTNGIIEQGISNRGEGTIIIGEEGNGVNTNSPIISGSYGINNSYSSNSGKIYFYDGVIKGTTNYWSTQFAKLEYGYELNEFEETIGSTTYKCANLIEGSSVAKIEETGTEYKDLAEAITYCNNSESESLTISILKDCSLYDSIIIANNKNLIIDLNEHKITFNISDTVTEDGDIINHGTLQIKNGTIESILVNLESEPRKLIHNYGTITLNDKLTISNVKNIYLYGIYNDENANAIIDADFTLNARMNYNNTKSYGIYNQNNGKVTVNGGNIKLNSSCDYSDGHYTYSTKAYTFFNKENGIIQINNGNININNSDRSTDGYTIFNNSSGNINISGGELLNPLSETSYTQNYCVYNNGTGNIQIVGGKITGYYGVYNYGTGNVIIGEKDNNIDQAVPEIIGKNYGIGKENGKICFYDGVIKGIENHLKNGIAEIEENALINEFEETIDEQIYKCINLIKANDNVAKIEETGEEFNKLDKAIETINGLEDGNYNITILKDCDLFKKIDISTNKYITININNHAIKSYISDNIEVENHGTLILKNGKITCNYTGKKENNHIIISNFGIIKMEDSVLIESQASYVRIIENEGILEVNNGSLNSINTNKKLITYAIYNKGNGSVKITDGQININGVGETYGIYNEGKGKIEINNVSIKTFLDSEQNKEGKMYGIYNKNKGIIEINNCDISNSYTYKYNYGPGVSYGIGSIYGYGIYNYDGDIKINNINILNDLNRDEKASSYTIYSYGISNNDSVDVENCKIVTTSKNRYSGITSGIYNMNSSSIFTIKEGTIISNEYGIYNSSTGTINVGTKDGVMQKSNPCIIGGTYGISNNSGTLKFYDGIVKGKTTSIYGNVSEVESNHIIKISTEDDYYCSTLIPQSKEDAVIYGNGTYYQTVQDAINACSDSTKTYLLTMVNGSTEDSITIGENQDIIIDLNGYSIISNSENPIFINNGKLQITDTGYDESTSKFGQIVNRKGSAIQNNGSNLTIGEITENDNIYTQAPIIQGETYGIENANSEAIISVYDGVIKGKTSALLNATINNIPEGYKIIKSTLDGIEIVTIEVIE